MVGVHGLMAQIIAIKTHTQKDIHSALRHRKVANHSRMVCSMHNLGIMFSKSSCVPEKNPSNSLLCQQDKQDV